MRKINKYVLLLLISGAFLFSSFQNEREINVKNNDMDQFVEALMSKMTLKDKVGEMTQLAIDVLSVGAPYNLKEPHEFDKKKLENVLVENRVGSILNVGGHAYSKEYWEEIHSTIQDYAKNKKDSGIPILYGIDAIHGTNYTLEATLFPQQLGQASTWNLELAETCGEVTAYETRASGIPWSFSPVLDIGRDARWPRLWETYGEDVFLASEMGKRFIFGMEGNDVSDKTKVASCMKHFLGYSVTLRGKDRGPAWIPDRQLQEYFIPTFKAAIDQGAKTIMICSGELNGIPVHADKRILTDLLRKDLGFNGLAVTDWEDIGYLVSRHRVAKDFKEAIGISINAGIDMAMVPMDVSFVKLLMELVEEGVVSMDRIDEAVKRILTLKKELGLFDEPFHSYKEFPDFASEKHRKAALQTAEESIILAKNENNMLPLHRKKKVLVVGPSSNSLNVLNGGWTGTWQGDNEKYNTPGKATILQAIENKIGKANVTYQKDWKTANTTDADVIIACIGEQPYTEKPGDIDDLDLEAAQVKMVNALAKTGKPVVLVVVEGRPRIIREIVDKVAAILVAFLPGNEGGEAFANVLFGDVNPSAKFPITYPKFSNDLLTYDHKGTDLVRRDFTMNGFDPQFEFGFGLSYTTFTYKNLNVTAIEKDRIKATVDVTNSGARKGKEVVQLYVTDEVASITPSVKRLRAFDKIELDPGETKQVTFTIHKKNLSFVGQDNKWVFEPGDFTFQIDGLKEKISL